MHGFGELIRTAYGCTMLEQNSAQFHLARSRAVRLPISQTSLRDMRETLGQQSPACQETPVDWYLSTTLEALLIRTSLQQTEPEASPKLGSRAIPTRDTLHELTTAAHAVDRSNRRSNAVDGAGSMEALQR